MAKVIPSSGPQIEILVIKEHHGRLTPQQVEAAREQMAGLKIHPRDALPNTAALARAEALHARLTGPHRAELGQLIAQFHAALESQNPELIEQTRNCLLGAVDQYGGRG